MTDLLTLGSSGLRSYSKALGTIGDNIANSQTAGYARRTTVIADQGGGMSASPVYKLQVMPNGSIATGVSRAIDPWLIEDARTSAADAGRTGAKLTWLENTETALANGGSDVGKAMTAMFNRADELAADPTNTARRSAFLDSMSTVALTFQSTAGSLARAADGAATAAKMTATQVNTDVEALARVNEGLRRATDGSSNQASLLDERDRLLDSISTALPAKIEYDIKGTVKLTVGGQTLLDGATRNMASVNVAGDGRLSLAVNNASVSISSGTLAGQIDGADHIASMRSTVDAQANAFATQMNAQQAAGRDSAGNPGAPIFTIGTGAADLVVNALTPSQVAAADSSSLNGNALAFGNLRGATGSEAAWTNTVALQSQTVSAARSQDQVMAARRDGSAQARDNVSAVDLDREAADLIRYQQAYDAAARVLQVARETMQSIMNAL